MFYKYYSNIFFFMIVPIILNAQDHSIHKKWKLDGAEERIEKNRKGDLVLEFVFKDKINNKSKSSIQIDLKIMILSLGFLLLNLEDFGDKIMVSYTLKGLKRFLIMLQ